MLARSSLLIGFAPFVVASAYGIDFADPNWQWRLPDAAPPVSFRALDVDHDGALTRAEARPNRLLADRFAAADINRDGVLSALEFNHAALVLGITAVEQSASVAKPSRASPRQP